MNAYCWLNFIKIWKFQLVMVKKSTKISGKISLSNICQKCDTFWPKTCCWCQRTLKFCTQANYLGLKKTSQNNFFLWGQQHCENWIWNMQIFTQIPFVFSIPRKQKLPMDWFHNGISLSLLQLTYQWYFAEPWCQSHSLMKTKFDIKSKWTSSDGTFLGIMMVNEGDDWNG